MFKKTALVLAVALLVTPLSPSVGLTWYSSPPEPNYHDRPYGHYRHYDRDYYHHDDDDAWLWVGGILLGALVLGAALQQPSPEPQSYIQPQQPQVYTFPPYVPPGMCRWERYILDGNGRYILDQYGQPVKEYTLGSCQFPPN
ncbi:MAG: hypothetical protein ACYDBT_04640 [Desulfobulbaceae bacterium]